MLTPLKPLLLLLVLLMFGHQGTAAKELIATHEWQRVGPTDTLPAGLEIRMDLSGGGKWARLLPPQKEIDPPHPAEPVPHKPRCGPSCKERQKKRREAGFLLREGRHSRRQQEEVGEFPENNHNNNWGLQEAGVFLVGLTIGLGVASRFRTRSGGSGLHES